MKRPAYPRALLLGTACAIVLASSAWAADFNIPAGDLESALNAYTSATGVDLIVATDAIRGVRTKGAVGSITPDAALSRLLSGTGFHAQRQPSGAIAIVSGMQSSAVDIQPMQLAQAAPSSRAALETVTVTSSKLGGADVQSIPIAITALSQEQLTATQTAGGPDLVKQVPNLTFTKTNFSGYSIQIRGIGTQAISVTTDPAVAVAFNDVPFLRNHFFEQEFYDVAQVEVLRGPQGTLYGRNATAGVVNLTSAKPSDQFEAMASGELGNYHQKRFEGMINLPIVDDRLDIRIAGEWTKRQGYSFNETTDQRIDGRDLWSGRLTIGWKPAERLQSYFIWEHFSEDDDRLRSGKQLCKTDPGPAEIDGVSTLEGQSDPGNSMSRSEFSQGCLPVSLYSSDAFGVPNGKSLSYIAASELLGFIGSGVNPYADAHQSTNLRVIQSTLNPTYKAKNDIVELNTDYAITSALTVTSQTSFNHDFLHSTEDYNRFNTAPGIFIPSGFNPATTFAPHGQVSDDGVFCDPQLGCTNRLVGEDLSEEHAWQLGQEFRLSSNFSGPFNFSLGGNYLHYETEENYYVFINSLTQIATVYLEHARPPYVGGVTDNSDCTHGDAYNLTDQEVLECVYIDPNTIPNLNGNGHNYFVSHNPYLLNSYALFGETYYSVTNDLKVTLGLRWTEDQKHFPLIPSQLLVGGWGYPVTGDVDQQWDQFTGRTNVTWTPKLNFTDQTLFYGSYAHGYKAGGANPPGATLLFNVAAEGAIIHPTHPLTFKPEFVDAFELGSKNTLWDGALTLNASAFYYNYEDYQISYIVDRTSVNLNFDAHVKGAEVEASWEPVPGLRFNFAGGWEDAVLAQGQQAIDLMDRTAGHSDWVVIKPAVTQASNCIVPAYVAATGDLPTSLGVGVTACAIAYNEHLDPVTRAAFDPSTDLILSDGTHYYGFDPATAPNNGEGFAKDLSGNKLPNAPPYTVAFGAQYSMPLTAEWGGTLRGDFYWQASSWARVWNDDPYDRLRGYTNLNLALILTSQGGWQVMLYDKNVFNTTAITGDFLNSDDSALTTNLFLTDPKLIGVRVTKNW